MKIIGVIAATLLLIGCQNLDSKPADWLLKGRVIVKTTDRADRLSIRWRQFNDDSEILLTGPLGASIARISAEDNRYILERPKTTPVYAGSLDELVGLAIGLDLPFSVIIPVLSGETRTTTVEEWRVAGRNYNEQNRPMLVEASGPGTNIRLIVQSWR